MLDIEACLKFGSKCNVGVKVNLNRKKSGLIHCFVICEHTVPGAIQHQYACSLHVAVGTLASTAQVPSPTNSNPYRE